MRKRDFLMGVIWTIFGVAITWEACRLGLGTFTQPGLGLTPFIVGSFLILFSVTILLISHDVKGALKDIRSIWSDIDIKPMGLVLLYIVAYAFFIEKAGYIITTFILLLFLSKTISSLKFRATVVISLSTVFISYVLFVIILKVPLPSGVWRIG